MKTRLLSALRRAEAAAEVRAVIITGAGPGFCAGQDLREHAEILAAGEAATDTVRLHYNPIIMTITTMPKPVIAAVDRVATGAGPALALPLGFRLAPRPAPPLTADPRAATLAFSRKQQPQCEGR